MLTELSQLFLSVYLIISSHMHVIQRQMVG